MEQFLVILRGTPASGKSTIAKRFRDFSRKIVWLKVDNFKDFFADDASTALHYVNGSAIATLDYLLDQKFSVVMDGVFQDTSVIDQAVSLAHKRNIKSIVYQIQCPLSVLQKRDKERPGVKEGIRRPLGDNLIAEIYQKLARNPYHNARSLDTGNLDRETCIAQIQSAVEV